MKIATYAEAKSYLESFIRPVLFQKITVKEGEETDPLQRMRVLLELLDNPHQKFRSIVVSGTSGKGSTAYLISHILSIAAYKTGLSVSPHLEMITERMQINGKNMEERDFVSFINEIKPIAEKMREMPVGEPSYFEILLAIAFLSFAQEQVDIAVVEVGIEGKYDATNVLTPLSFVLTNISLDHTAILGDTVEAIAYEATAAIKQAGEAIDVISGVKQPGIISIVRDRCEKTGNKLQLSGEAFSSSDYVISKTGSQFTFKNKEGVQLENLSLSLLGSYQIQNAALAIQTCLSLKGRDIVVQEEHIRQALQTAFFPGRFEVLTYHGKTMILDGAHNEEKMKAFVHGLEELYPGRKKVFIVSFKQDKDMAALVGMLLPLAIRIVTTAFDQPTDLSVKVAANPEMISQLIKTINPQMEERILVTATTKEAMKAVAEESPDTMVVVTGSLYLIGEARSLLKRETTLLR